MEIVKIPQMEKAEYDRLIKEEYISRVVFKDEKYPYIAPFLYVFNGDFMYFLSTKYGKKIRYFQQNPYVTVEIEKYRPDLSNYAFVTLSGRLVKVEYTDEKKTILEKFVNLIREKSISKNIMIALGYSHTDPLEAIISEERTILWKLVDVERIIGFKDGIR